MFEFLWFIFYLYVGLICFMSMFVLGVAIFLYLFDILFLFILFIVEAIRGIFYSLVWIPIIIIIYFIKTICYKAFYYLSKFIKFAYQKIKSKK
jgi:hypothetical protein